MKKIFYITIKAVTLLTLVFFNSCSDEPTASLEKYPSANLPAPVLSTLQPSAQALAGVTVITITGSNFSADARNNLVVFNGVPGTVLNATATQLVVRAPNVVADTVLVKIAVVGAQDFSNVFQYKMVPAWEEFYPFDKIAEKNYGIIIDISNNLLVSLLGKGIYKITPPPDTSKSIYAPAGTYTGKWDNFRYGPGGELYGVRSQRGVWKIVEGATVGSPWVSPTTLGITLKALEFDNYQNLWTIHDIDKIFRIKQDRTITEFPFTGVLRAIRMLNNDLYISASKDNIEGVWRIPITSNGDLGTEELYFDLTGIKPGRTINAIAFAADGDLVLGLSEDKDLVAPSPDALMIVKPDKSYADLYPGVIEAKSVVCMYWPSTGTSLYFVRGEELNTDDPPKVVVSQTTIRVEMEKTGAPYYGQ